MAERYASFDFHSHCLWSYDAATPLEYYFTRARELKLRAFAVTDHHNFDAFEEILEVAKAFPGVPFVPGAEMTVKSPVWSGDMVCLGLPRTPPEKLQKVFDIYHQLQRDWGDGLSELLRQRGFNYDANVRRELLLLYRPERVFAKQGITHVRNEIQRDYLLAHGMIKDAAEYGELMYQVNSPEHNYESTKLLEANAVIDAVHDAGGVALIAHPYGYFRGLNEKRMDEVMEAVHFDGIECAHPSVPEEATHFYRAYCEKHHLLSSAGTDCHEAPGQTPYHLSAGRDFARHCGEERWLDELLERIKLWNVD